MDICIVAGARPNFIKVAPVVRALNEVRQQSKDVNYMLVYTGSVDDPTIEPTLFDDLQIPKPDMYLGVDCDNLNEQTGQVMSHFDKYLQRHHTDVVVVVDDLASTLAVAIVTKKHGIALAHGGRFGFHFGRGHSHQEARRSLGSYRRGYPQFRPCHA